VSASGEAKRKDLAVDHDEHSLLTEFPLRSPNGCHHRCPCVQGHLSHGFDRGQEEQEAEGKGEGN